MTEKAKLLDDPLKKENYYSSETKEARIWLILILNKMVFISPQWETSLLTHMFSLKSEEKFKICIKIIFSLCEIYVKTLNLLHGNFGCVLKNMVVITKILR